MAYLTRARLFLCLIIAFVLLSTIYSCKNKPAPEVPVKKLSVEARIMKFYDQWKGTPYKLGGMDTSGIDCSALTQRLYKEVFHVELPRRVVEQRVEGKPVSRDSLKAGDLIVFKGSLFGRPHIGVHIAKGDFMHASSSKGVTISNLSEQYWYRKFKMARRMIDDDGNLILDVAEN